MAVNLKQLAELLGLSQTTVSRALNGYPEVNAETRQRVLQAVRETGYRPNRAAQRLATGKAYSIGMVMPIAAGIDSDVHFGEFLAGLGEEAVKHDFHFVLNPSAPEDEEATFQRLAASGNVDALFLAYMRANDPRIAMLKSLSMPFVVHGRSIGEARDYPFLDIDNTGAFYDATRLLIQLGHQRIALINGPDYLTFSIRRHKGMAGAGRAWAQPRRNPRPPLAYDRRTRISQHAALPAAARRADRGALFKHRAGAWRRQGDQPGGTGDGPRHLADRA